MISSFDPFEFTDSILGKSITKVKNDDVTVKCNNCDTDENDITDSNGYLICSLCGVVISSVISELAEWSNYVDSSGSTSNNSRCGVSTSTTDINPFNTNMSSFIPKGVKNVCIQDGKVVRYDISKIHIKNSFNHLQKSFNLVEEHLDNITNDKYSKRIVNTAKMLWGEIMESKVVTRAGVRKGLIACCLYYACIHHECTKSPLEICEDFGMKDTKQFNKGDKEFKKTFENIDKWSHLLTKTSNSEEYFSRLCCELEMGHVIMENTAFQLSVECKKVYEPIKDELVGLHPKSAACGIIFWVMKNRKMHITKSVISKVLGICSPTLSKTCQLIVNYLGKP